MTVSLPGNTPFEYKFVRKETDGSVSVLVIPIGIMSLMPSISRLSGRVVQNVKQRRSLLEISPLAPRGIEILVVKLEWKILTNSLIH